LTEVHTKVPPEHRAEFDALLSEARLTYRIRDERNFYSDALALGLARRAILEAGRRLETARRIERRDHLLDASADEIAALLQGTPGPSASQLAARFRHRTESSMDSMPDRLGFPPSPPPPADWLPGDAARLQRAVGVSLGMMFDRREAAQSPKQLKGFAASPGVFEGTARVVRGAAELSSVQAGDVLVTPSTSPTFNVVLPLISAIVTERGGALSHAAIVAREYGLPAVVGVEHATRRIRDGQRIRVCGTEGYVELLPG
jgi:rifampicin phosphotransferase